MHPYLSIITTARNDNHGGNMLHRMQIFVNGLLAQSAKFQLNTELIIVEWNPPPEKPRLAEDLKWPEKHDYCMVRIIEVPKETHRRYKYADRMPLYQMIAKNVGIRRAHGDFILATNIDILFSDNLFAFFASKKLTKGKMYRAIRFDIPSDIPLEASIKHQLSFCRSNVIRINDKYGTKNLKTKEYFSVCPPELEKDSFYSAKMGPILFTNGCGDFQLMAAEHWNTLYGYPELDLFSIHLDSLMEYIAHFAGIREEILSVDMRIYHIEHASGWSPEAVKNGTFEKRLSNIPRLTDYDLRLFQMKMNQEKRPIIFNNAKWGQHLENFPETIITKGKCQNPEFADRM